MTAIDPNSKVAKIAKGISMSNQRVSREQGDVIITALQRSLQKERLNPATIYARFVAWCDDRAMAPDLCDMTLGKWCKAALSDKNPRPVKAGRLLDYALKMQQEVNPEDWREMFVRSASKLFASNDETLTKRLKRLDGTYQIIRKRWKPSGSDQYIQCIVWFDAKSDVIRFGEVEKLGKSSDNDDDRVDEEYDGYTFLFGTNIWALAREKRGNNIKFINIHYCYQSLFDGDEPITRCRGNLTAVCGSGPCDSARFVLRRTKAGARGCSYLSLTDVRNLLDKEDYEYLCS